jgi:hypothetical protein
MGGMDGRSLLLLQIPNIIRNNCLNGQPSETLEFGVITFLFLRHSRQNTRQHTSRSNNVTTTAETAVVEPEALEALETASTKIKKKS